MPILFSKNKIIVTENSITFPSGFFFTESTTLSRNMIVSVTYKYDNMLMFYFWRFFVGTLQLFTIIGILEALKVLRGDILVSIVTRENFNEKIYSFWLKHTLREDFKIAIR